MTPCTFAYCTACDGPILTDVTSVQVWNDDGSVICEDHDLSDPTLFEDPETTYQRAMAEAKIAYDLFFKTKKQMRIDNIIKHALPKNRRE